ncbi:hypothetical protein GUI51_13445 [Enterococcus mundtii]|uniref:Uncharacterized protein n=1 Tax=Enterococcus mundtii TaxID=53346 RepID=A0ABQ0VIV3_ENTMU|nr:hypothetical protein [Enterococcus mundtii]MZU11430.1 hypothetical protein [Bifidobacterium longum]GEN18591.1 hypothetical protein LAC02_18720 [Ligilactobacillus acidipiscis]AUB54423.1 hypothetical protein EM4838_15505 [Enterococcus mundtii]MZZ60071.1 hypothetical protein [Enterococcus mundtii]MZZ63075.1 hypothetical protein [Enterococcus mundtii]
MLDQWINHSMGSNGRENLEKSDKYWEDFYNSDPEYRYPKGDLLFRVHSGGYDEPVLDDYVDRGDYQDKIFREKHDLWKARNDISCIEFNSHWVSFTKDVDVIGSDYFSGKDLRGFVIVMKAEKAIDISSFKEKGFNEYEVVAPMTKDTLVEILDFDGFMNKYGKGTSYYEKNEMKKS